MKGIRPFTFGSISQTLLRYSAENEKKKRLLIQSSALDLKMMFTKLNGKMGINILDSM